MGKRTSLRVLRALVHERGVSQTQLARAAKMKRLRYWAIENGEQEPTADERRAIASVLGVPVERIDWPVVLKVKAS